MTTTDGRDEPTESPGRPRRPWQLDVLVRLVIGFAVLALLTHLVARPFVIPSGSMEPTLRVGDRIIAQVAGVDEADLDRGTVIAFAHGETWEEESLDEPNPAMDLIRYAGDLLGVGPSHHAHTVKRVIGLPGETVSCCDPKGRVLVDGRPLEEPWKGDAIPFAEGTDCTPAQQDRQARAPSRRCFPEITVPDGAYLVLGDNRAGSSDSVAGCRGRLSATDCAPRFVDADQVVGVVAWRWWPLPPGDALRQQ